jgi:ATP-dependent DNA helicase PIF1
LVCKKIEEDITILNNDYKHNYIQKTMSSQMNQKVLSLEQEYAFNKFCEGQNLLVCGSGGTGKSLLIENMVKYLHQKGNVSFQVTGLTGCCSVLLSNNIKINGRNLPVKTLSSWSGIRLCKGSNEPIIQNVLKNKFLVKTWRSIKVLIVDEVSMLNAKMFTVLEEIGRRTRRNSYPFGGIQIVLLGDHLQLPPVPDSQDPETLKFCFEAEQWYNVIPHENHIELKTIFRQKDPIFREILNEVRIGELSQKNKEILQAQVGKKYNPDDHNGVIPIELFATRNQVSNINRAQYDKVEGEQFIFISKVVTNCTYYIENSKPLNHEDVLKCRHLTPQSLEYEIKNLKNNIPTEDQIYLKVGVPVMILVNLDIDESISNGTLGIISKIKKVFGVSGEHYVPTVRFSNGKERQIEPYLWQNSDFPTIVISQLPLTLSYASSIHKQQGASIECARMNLGHSIFEDSQTYVALSRITSLDGLYLDAFHANKITVNKKAKDFYASFPHIEYEKVETIKQESIKVEENNIKIITYRP